MREGEMVKMAFQKSQRINEDRNQGYGDGKKVNNGCKVFW